MKPIGITIKMPVNTQVKKKHTIANTGKIAVKNTGKDAGLN